MKVEQFLEDLGMRPKSVPKHQWNSVKKTYDRIEEPNTRIVITSARKPERELIRNNLQTDLIYARKSGPIVLFAIKIRGGYAFYYMNRIFGLAVERVSTQRFKNYMVALDTFDTVEVIENNEAMMGFIMLAHELGG